MESIEKEKQIRLTFQDTMQAQDELHGFIWSKYTNNDFIHIPERQGYVSLVDKSFLSEGNFRIAFYKDGNTRIPLGPVHTFSLQLSNLFSSTVEIQRYDFKKTIQISELWKILLDEMPFIFPPALEESLHMSAEMPRGEQRTAFEWGHEKGFKQ